MLFVFVLYIFSHALIVSCPLTIKYGVHGQYAAVKMADMKISLNIIVGAMSSALKLGGGGGKIISTDPALPSLYGSNIKGTSSKYFHVIY